VILPPSALDRLTNMMIDDYPMLFEVSNQKHKKKTHCGVLEFVAEEGVVYLPYWMMQNLLLTEGDIVRVQYTKLMKGNYVKLRPQTKDFLDISNPKAVLETTLRSYTCLTVGDSILINYNNKRYFIDIVEARPNDAVSIVDTDCEVDFAPPLDYVEPVRSAGAGDGDKPGEPMDLGGDAEKKKARRDDISAGGSKLMSGDETSAAGEISNEKTFLAFAGGGNRLDGKAARADLAPKPVELPTTSLKLSKEFEQFIRGPPAGNPGNPGETKKESDASASGLPRRKAGKLVFGGAGGVGRESRAAEKAKAPEKKEEKKEEKAKFTAFQGSGNKLK
jgi:ubiquitin fusion degradation protein 1